LNIEINLKALNDILFFPNSKYLARSNIAEIKRAASGGKFLYPHPVVILDIDSELAKLLGGNCVGLV
jgi:hypothetical protein